MESRLIDITAQFPEVSPDDVWEDVAGFGFDGENTATSLPAKRVRAENPSPAAAAGRDTPLRIAPQSPAPVNNGGPSPGLEVQEINGRVLRLEPEESAASRMPRQVAFRERQSHPDGNHPASGETREWGRSKRQSIVWILGTGMAVACTVVGALTLLPMVNESNAARPRPGQIELVLDPDERPKDASSLTAILARQDEAERLFHAFASASSPNAVLPLVRDPAVVEPLIRAERRPPLTSGTRRLQRTSNWSAFETNGLTYGLLKGDLPDLSDFSAYFVLSDGRLRLDWKASTAYGTASFAELERKKGNPGEIRGWISASDFYTLAFPENEFQSYQLASPDRLNSVWCYSRRGEAASERLNQLLKGGDILKSKAESVKITLQLESGPDDALANQWLIGEVLHKDWISP